MTQQHSPNNAEVKAHYVGILKTKKEYMVNIKVYENAFRISRAFNYNPTFFRENEQRLYVFWRFDEEGRICAVEMRLHPNECTETKILEVQNYKPIYPAGYKAKAICCNNMNSVASTIDSRLRSPKIEIRYEGLINFGHTLSHTTARHITDGKVIRVSNLKRGHIHLEQLLKNEEKMNMLRKAGSMQAAIKDTQNGLFTIIYS